MKMFMRELLLKKSVTLPTRSNLGLSFGASISSFPLYPNTKSKISDSMFIEIRRRKNQEKTKIILDLLIFLSVLLLRDSSQKNGFRYPPRKVKKAIPALWEWKESYINNPFSYVAFKITKFGHLSHQYIVDRQACNKEMESKW